MGVAVFWCLFHHLSLDDVLGVFGLGRTEIIPLEPDPVCTGEGKHKDTPLPDLHSVP